jgi:hypothetical protein
MMVLQNSPLIQMLKLLHDLGVTTHLRMLITYSPVDPMGYYDALDPLNPWLDIRLYE